MADNKIIRIDWDDRMVTNAQNKAKKLGKIKNSIYLLPITLKTQD